MWRSQYELSSDGTRIATWHDRLWRNGGTLELEGRRYEVKSNLFATRYEMTDEAGEVVAVADRIGRKRWTVESNGQLYRFRRASWWRHEEQLLEGDQPIGSVKRVSAWRSDAVADLPGLPLPLQVFVFTIVLTAWDAQAAAASS
ncbi:hypothetical protein Lesp02_63250 [Lentzea sp. NBRC 105346]|nr:hypothetical protein Lesp02_63250 [Lentzea sp. NBRC 105346]